MIASPRIQIPHFARNFNIELQSPRCIDFHLEPLTPNSISTLKSPAQNIFRKASRHVSEKLPALDYKSRTSLVSSRASFDDHAKLRNAAETPRGETTKISAKQNGCVKAYAASTNSGLVRGYNEDRVSIINNILKPAERVGEN